MQRPLEDFLRALRACDVRISPAEAIDAYRAVAEVGFGDRQLFRDALCVTLAKTAEEIDRFETCFDTFWVRDEFTDATIAENGMRATDRLLWPTCCWRETRRAWPKRWRARPPRRGPARYNFEPSAI